MKRLRRGAKVVLRVAGTVKEAVCEGRFLPVSRGRFRRYRGPHQPVVDRTVLGFKLEGGGTVYDGFHRLSW